uniref:DUF7869 domain-containing protein n=1 Tax=Photinus pyralis TaxID=7054 RepID=A0A1Y1N893_PHOPY
MQDMLDFSSDDSVEDPNFLPMDLEDDESDITEKEDSDILQTTIGRTNTEEDTAQNKNKKRVNKETRAMRHDRKEKRNLGQEYIARSGKIVPGKTMRELKICRNKCKEKFGDEVRIKLFKDFWAMASYNRRLQYIADLMDVKEKSTTRIRCSETNKQRYRQNTIVYYLQVNGVRFVVCKDCFMKTFDISKKFIEVTVAKKCSESSGVVTLDQRGKHENRKKIPDNDKEKAKDHILSIPMYESHYTRRQSSRKYLPSYYTLTSMYEAYKMKNPTNFINRKMYEKIFHELNISIKKPKKDTCGTCDKMKMKISMCKSEDETAKLKEELSEHHLKADQGYSSKDRDKTFTKTSEDTKTITFDLQQCLPTPDLQSGESFYKRQLWTFNLTVHDCDNSQAYCYLWYESLAKRGGNEIGSCLYSFMTKDLNPRVKHLRMYSDCCPGQNRNSFISAACLSVLQQSENLEMIDHKFLIPGHTHMECDTDHSIIEKKKKKFCGKIEHPHDWAQLIRQAGAKHPFLVTEMQQSDFFDFAGLFGRELVNRKTDNENNKVNWRQIRWLRYEKSKQSFQYKLSFDEEEPFKTVNLEKRGRSVADLVPKQAYSKPVPITSEKKQHLMDLLPYISQSLWDFYRNLTADKDLRDLLPDSSSDED